MDIFFPKIFFKSCRIDFIFIFGLCTKNKNLTLSFSVSKNKLQEDQWLQWWSWGPPCHSCGNRKLIFNEHIWCWPEIFTWYPCLSFPISSYSTFQWVVHWWEQSQKLSCRAETKVGCKYYQEIIVNLAYFRKNYLQRCSRMVCWERRRILNLLDIDCVTWFKSLSTISLGSTSLSPSGTVRISDTDIAAIVAATWHTNIF